MNNRPTAIAIVAATLIYAPQLFAEHINPEIEDIFGVEVPNFSLSTITLAREWTSPWGGPSILITTIYKFQIIVKNPRPDAEPASLFNFNVTFDR
jgi:vacuolar-type H+-ATPase subunit D/Vma8